MKNSNCTIGNRTRYLPTCSAVPQPTALPRAPNTIIMINDKMIYLLTVIGSTPGGSSTVHIYIQTIHRTTQLTTLVGRLSGIRTQSGQTKINDELTA